VTGICSGVAYTMYVDNVNMLLCFRMCVLFLSEVLMVIECSEFFTDGKLWL